MNATTTTAKIALVALLACWCVGDPSTRPRDSPQDDRWDRRTTVSYTLPVDPRLRSAFLIRARGGQWPTPAVDVADATAKLQEHFDAVLAILEQNQTPSLDLALERLETSFGRTFAADERALWRLTLAARRAENLQRLTVYRDRGQFPLNEGHADHAVPIFVDRHDTPCAVGHLMRESGWEEQVDSIARDNLFVCLTDVRRGVALDWTLQSGLTAEEAALVQPAYDPPVAQVTLAEAPNFGFASNIRVRKFEYRGGLPLIPNIPFPVQPAWTDVDATTVGLRSDFGELSSDSLGFPVSYEPSISLADMVTLSPLQPFGAVAAYPPLDGPVPNSHENADFIWMSFDIQTTPDRPFDQLGLMMAAGFNFGRLHSWTFVTNHPLAGTVDPQIGIQVQSVNDPFGFPEHLLAVTDVNLSYGPPLPTALDEKFTTSLDFFNNEFGTDHVDLPPVEKVTVNTIVALASYQSDRSALGGLTHAITFVPEPSQLLLLAMFGLGLPTGRKGLLLGLGRSR